MKPHEYWVPWSVRQNLHAGVDSFARAVRISALETVEGHGQREPTPGAVVVSTQHCLRVRHGAVGQAEAREMRHVPCPRLERIAARVLPLHAFESSALVIPQEVQLTQWVSTSPKGIVKCLFIPLPAKSIILS